VEVARLKLQATEVDLRDIQKRVEAGLAAQLDYDKARLARDAAAAEYLRQQQLHTKYN
jgi:outer membrane protein TolC